MSIKSEKLLSLCRPEKVEIELVFRIQTCFEYNIVHFLQIHFSLAYILQIHMYVNSIFQDNKNTIYAFLGYIGDQFRMSEVFEI